MYIYQHILTTYMYLHDYTERYVVPYLQFLVCPIEIKAFSVKAYIKHPPWYFWYC